MRDLEVGFDPMIDNAPLTASGRVEELARHKALYASLPRNTQPVINMATSEHSTLFVYSVYIDGECSVKATSNFKLALDTYSKALNEGKNVELFDTNHSATVARYTNN